MIRVSQTEQRGTAEDRTETSTLESAFAEGRECLARVGVPDPALDAWYLLEYVTGISRASYYMEPGRELPGRQYAEYRECLARRAQRVPLQHITGEQEFMGLLFHVNPHVLIPRQDTEVLVEQALEILKAGCIPQTAEGTLQILDMCTGSGCILLSFLHYAGKIKSAADAGWQPEGTGADLSQEALAAARENAQILGIPAEFVQGSLFENVRGRYGLILSNPPYIRTADIEMLQDEVRLYDPREALDGKEDGLYFYRCIVNDAREHLLPGGYLLFEIGHDQAEDVSGLMHSAGYTEIRVKKDLAGLDRVVYGRYS